MKERIRSIVKSEIGEGDFDVRASEKETFGHYTTNVALRLAKERRQDSLALAQELAVAIRKRAPEGFFEKVEVVKPGFINFWITPRALQEEFEAFLKRGEANIAGGMKGKKTIIIEYSQPNIAKRMHVGHLRTTILGDALANIFETLGYRTVRWNYLGDWGTQFGILIAAYKRWGKEDEVKRDPINTLQALYVKFHREMEKHPELAEKSREEFRKLEQGDEENTKLWRWFKQESLAEFKRIYELLEINFDTDKGEASFEKAVKPLVQELLERKIAKESEGAVVIPLEKAELPPALIQKSDGTSLYLSRDIAALRERLETYHPEKILYVVGNEQTLHFAQLFEIAKLLRLSEAELVHVKFGLILGESGRKLATREGRVIFLDEVVMKAIELAGAIVEKKNPGIESSEKEKIARTVGIGALKYSILKEHRNSDITFNWDKMLDFKGDSAPYLQYTYARLQSILGKANRESDFVEKDRKAIKADLTLLTEAHELSLMRHIFEFPEVLREVARTYLPNVLAIYLYELANRANRYYEAVPILIDENASRREARLELVISTARVLKEGLRLLGIKTLERI